MNAKEYLSQGYRLEKMIRLQMREIEELRELCTSISSPGFTERYSASKSTDAPFEKVLLRAEEMERKLAGSLDKYLAFKQEIMEVFDKIEDRDQRIVLHYRYLCNWTWNRIGDELNWDERTIRRIHNKALEHVEIPDNPVII